MGKALIAQVGTGEGKSLIIAMMAIYFVKVLGKRVHILENNQGLLDKDVETMKPLFAEFGILTQHEGSKAEDKPR
jgi:preprotein translocase subunit SecA